MTYPTPKYAIGQTVYAGDCGERTERIQCPECLGEGTWEVRTPCGNTFDITCGTCHYSYEYSMRNELYRSHFEPLVLTLTIGSCQLDTADSECVVSYMCRETGVGSGRIWKEHDLRETPAEAMVTAQFKAAKATETKQEQEAKRIADAKAAARRKPSYEQRRIRELEKQLKSLQLAGQS